MSETATVEVLTAEVRVLMVGSRQVTLSVYRQLDRIPLCALKAFGRVQAGQVRGFDEWSGKRVDVVGASREGVLCASWMIYEYGDSRYTDPGGRYAIGARGRQVWEELNELPLIVLAGLR